MTINSNSGQSMITFSAHTCKITLYAIYLAEQGKEIGMSHRKLVCYRLSIFGVSYVRELLKREQVTVEEELE